MRHLDQIKYEPFVGYHRDVNGFRFSLPEVIRREFVVLTIKRGVWSSQAVCCVLSLNPAWGNAK